MSFTVPFFCATSQSCAESLERSAWATQAPAPTRAEPDSGIYLLLSMNPPFWFGKMNASGDELGHRCFQSHRSSASSFETWTMPKLFRVLPQGPDFAFVYGFRQPHG